MHLRGCVSVSLLCARVDVYVSAAMFHNDNDLSVRPPVEQMGYEPARETRRKSGVRVCPRACVRVSVMHMHAHMHKGA